MSLVSPGPMPVAPGAWRYAGLGWALAVPSFFVSPLVSALLVLAGGFTLWFFRDPERNPPADGAVAPADGRIAVIREEAGRLRVGVFMSVTDVHVNRAPVGGTIEALEHRPGAHVPAFSKDSDRNEQVRMDFGDHVVVLIAGAFARRITPYVEVGDVLRRGERLGHIAFGSRADVILPPGYRREHLRVGPGDPVRAGETVLARR